MNFAFTTAQLKLRDEIVAFIEREMTPEMFEEAEHIGYVGPAGRVFRKKLAARGWLTASWPKEWGGAGLSKVDSLIIMDTLWSCGATFPFVAAWMVGPILMKFATPEQIECFVKPIASGDIEFALGYSEPGAGSDLAALNIRAVEDGDCYVINGQKVFNTACHYANYHWLACRTGDDKHKGISMFIVDLKSPGITIRPLWTMASGRTNEVYYENVRVPKANMVGEPGQGFAIIRSALSLERALPSAEITRNLHDLINYLREAKAGGRPVIEDPVIRRQIAELQAEAEAANLFSYYVAWMQDAGKGALDEWASANKALVTDLKLKLSLVATTILGPFGQLERGTKWAANEGLFGKRLRYAVAGPIHGGTNEIQRNVIAERGYALPRR